MRRTGTFFLFALVSIPRAALPQGDPLGLEFRINTYTTGPQRSPGSHSVASDQSGNFVVVWTSPQDGSLGGVFGQRYASSGTPLGPEFRVNTYTTDNQNYPSVASDASGNFVAVWSSDEQDGSNHGVFGQRYASSGAPDGPEFRINTYTTGTQFVGSVAADAAGNFVVVWTSFQPGDPGGGIFGQRYASSGAPDGPEFRVNTYTTDWQNQPSVASDTAGNFVVVWWTYNYFQFSTGVFGQRYASSGTPLGPEFRVNTYTSGPELDGSVAADAAGNFVVVWHSYGGQDGDDSGVFGQRYASSGTALGPEFRVNTYTTLSQRHPSVAADSSGNFVVVWEDDSQDGFATGVFGQRYASTGTALGPEFRVNTYTTEVQFAPSVAVDSAGNFVVVWDSYGDGSGIGVFGQRYGRIVPVELMRLTVE